MNRVDANHKANQGNQNNKANQQAKDNRANHRNPNNPLYQTKHGIITQEQKK